MPRRSATTDASRASLAEQQDFSRAGEAAPGAPANAVPLLAATLDGDVSRVKSLLADGVDPDIHDDRTVFAGLPQDFDATRYHSLVIEKASLPDCLEVSAWTAAGMRTAQSRISSGPAS